MRSCGCTILAQRSATLALGSFVGLMLGLSLTSQQAMMVKLMASLHENGLSLFFC